MKYLSKINQWLNESSNSTNITEVKNNVDDILLELRHDDFNVNSRIEAIADKNYPRGLKITISKKSTYFSSADILEIVIRIKSYLETTGYEFRKIEYTTFDDITKRSNRYTHSINAWIEYETLYMNDVLITIKEINSY